MVRTETVVSWNRNQEKSLLTDEVFVLIKPFQVDHRFKINNWNPVWSNYTISVWTHLIPKFHS